MIDNAVEHDWADDDLGDDDAVYPEVVASVHQKGLRVCLIHSRGWRVANGLGVLERALSGKQLTAD